MKKLTLTGKLQSKLSRLSSGVEQLYFDGIDPHDLADQVCVAVVGTRKPTPHGKDITEKIVTALAGEGVTIISGLAFGVDITSHRAALQAGGTTVAVIASDLHHIYPASHKLDAEKIARSGCILSEHTSNPHPRPYDFLERNRIIAALSDAVIIPEAAERSGSLNTARHAQSMNIPLFAVPGRSIDLMSAGTNQLIRKNEAALITSADDIYKALNIRTTPKRTSTKGNDACETAILAAIKSGIHDTTLLQTELGLDTTKLQTKLTMLEINGRISQDAVGSWHIT